MNHICMIRLARFGMITHAIDKILLCILYQIRQEIPPVRVVIRERIGGKQGARTMYYKHIS